ncbi:hypothetical protein DPMN_107033 [Dreissena polymorpha]|uniref:Uncharacterized protein n=1 Tax=Dreissena polymorpha TaxID=45954 RepID=A0A9D4K614_DREPO|nr:hypothetical protein DPMN_107033 [Dreissena polymorpha]
MCEMGLLCSVVNYRALSAVTFGATLGCLALYISEYRPVMEAIPIYGRKYKAEPIEPID